MTHFPSLDPTMGLLAAMRLNPAASRLLIAYHTEIMRGSSALSEAERELIAAFVSGLNACRYCYGVHAATAEAFGIEPDVLERLIEDPAAEAAPAKLRPLLALARKLTLEQARLTNSDVAAALEAGWDERAVHDAINVIALFNFMNRYAHGHGVTLADDVLAERGRRLQSQGYDRLIPLLEP